MILQDITDLVDGFPSACRTHRKLHGHTGAEVADRTGLTENIISRFERGESKNPGIYNVVAYAKAIGFSLDDYFGIVDHGSIASDAVELRTSVKFLERDIEYRDDRINYLIRSRRMISFSFVAVVALCVVGVVLIDLFNPYFGLFWRQV